MTLKINKVAAWAIVATLPPYMIGRAADPYNQDGAIKAWARGAAVVGGALALAWAIDEVGRPAAQ